MYDAVRDEHKPPANGTTSEYSHHSGRPSSGNLAMLLSPNGAPDPPEDTSSYFFDPDEDPEEEQAEEGPQHQPEPQEDTATEPEPPQQDGQPEPEADVITERVNGHDSVTAPPKTIYNPQRISPARDLLKPLRPQDLYINPALNVLRFPNAAATAASQEPPQASSSKKRLREEEEQPAKPAKHLRAEEAIISHYNERRNISLNERKLSPIIGLKNFNNWVKTVLINKFCVNPLEQEAAVMRPDHHNAMTRNALRMVGGQALNTKMQTGRNLKVLDMGCGKGGDLNKWAKVGTSQYIGFDIAEKSIEQAQERYASNSSNRRAFTAEFRTMDCFSRPLDEGLSPEESQRPFDVVSMQFCLHYAFENESKARMMLENVSKHLRYGGMFVGTIPDSELILERLREIPTESGPPYAFGNSRYSITFDEKPDQDPDTFDVKPFGTKYTFFLQDAVDNVPEYLVPWHHLEDLAREYGLELVHFSTFSDLFYHEREVSEFAQLMRRMNVVNHNGESDMDLDEWEAATIYVAFAFVKN